MSAYFIVAAVFVLALLFALGVGFFYGTAAYSSCTEVGDCSGYSCVNGICDCSYHMYSRGNCNLASSWLVGASGWLIAFFVLFFLFIVWIAWVYWKEVAKKEADREERKQALVEELKNKGKTRDEIKDTVDAKYPKEKKCWRLEGSWNRAFWIAQGLCVAGLVACMIASVIVPTNTECASSADCLNGATCYVSAGVCVCLDWGGWRCDATVQSWMDFSNAQNAIFFAAIVITTVSLGLWVVVIAEDETDVCCGEIKEEGEESDKSVSTNKNT